MEQEGVMNGVGIGCSILGSTTIVATVYMMEHGFKWWQIALVILLGMGLSPQYRNRMVDE